MTRGDGARRRRHLSILPALLAAAACAGGQPPPPAPSAAPAAAASRPAGTSGPVTRFDGRYVGTLALQPDRTRRCPEPPNIERELFVQNGRARFMFNPQVQQVR